MCLTFQVCLGLSVSTRPQCLPHKNWKVAEYLYSISPIALEASVWRSQEREQIVGSASSRLDVPRLFHTEVQMCIWENLESMNLRSFQKLKNILLFNWLYGAGIMLDVWKRVTSRTETASSVCSYLGHFLCLQVIPHGCTAPKASPEPFHPSELFQWLEVKIVFCPWNSTRK